MARGPRRISRTAHPRTVKRLGLGSLDFALRSVRGGKRAIMEEIAPMATQFESRLEPAKWHQLTPWQRRSVTLDDLAVEAGLTKGEFLAAIVRAGFEFTEEITDLLVACAFPSVIGACVRRGKMASGFVDRQLLLEHCSGLAVRKRFQEAASQGSPRRGGESACRDSTGLRGVLTEAL